MWHFRDRWTLNSDFFYELVPEGWVWWQELGKFKGLLFYILDWLKKTKVIYNWMTDRNRTYSVYINKVYQQNKTRILSKPNINWTFITSNIYLRWYILDLCMFLNYWLSYRWIFCICLKMLHLTFEKLNVIKKPVKK